ncbi:S-adenosylmethionine decarboxylase [Neisseria sp. HSC-16F19]|nr:adenosylmethionine decarboxylase [Neisseria sp. HSC-16F19]MCP2041374.1 S-adenosylmethionine decarboxylase [Neisseria sp. HSC-16F19]
MTLPEHSLQRHGLLDLYGVDAAAARDEALIRRALYAAAEAAEATVLAEHFHTFGGEGGITGMLLLAESHISIHTWPEHGHAAVDIFVCGRLRLEAAHRALCQHLPAARQHWRIIARGQH